MNESQIIKSMNLKPGDKLVCTRGCRFPDLTEGKIYTISEQDFSKKFNWNYFCLKEDEGSFFWSMSRFKPYNYRNEKLDRILC
jgi:hypothetical protein